jgi:hypothetical protein
MAMLAQDFRHLLPHGEHRVERGHGFLKDHADAVAPDGAHVFRSQGQQIFPGKMDLTLNFGGVGGQEAHDRQRGDGLAAARLAHQAQGLPGLDVQIYPGHGPEAAQGRVEMDVEVLHLEEGRVSGRHHPEAPLPGGFEW